MTLTAASFVPSFSLSPSSSVQQHSPSRVQCEVHPQLEGLLRRPGLQIEEVPFFPAMGKVGNQDEKSEKGLLRVLLDLWGL